MLPDGERWVRLVVYGQSFILHQIRKMVGTALAVFRGAAPEDAIASALRREGDVATPMAPELGLFLAETVYSHYNATWAGDNGRDDDDDDDDDDEDEEEGGEGDGVKNGQGDKKDGDDASNKIDPALRQQHREYMEQQARQKQKLKKKRECLSLGAWGDAAEKFKVREPFFFGRFFPSPSPLLFSLALSLSLFLSLSLSLSSSLPFSSFSSSSSTRTSPASTPSAGPTRSGSARSTTATSTSRAGAARDAGAPTPAGRGSGKPRWSARWSRAGAPEKRGARGSSASGGGGGGGDRAQRSGGRGRGGGGAGGRGGGGAGGRGGGFNKQPAAAAASAAPPPARSPTGYDDASMAAEWSD